MKRKRLGQTDLEISRVVFGSMSRRPSSESDLCQIHHPDPSVPIEESLGELDRLMHEGKILHIGVSNFSGREIDTALAGLARLQPPRSNASAIQAAME